MKRLFVMFLCLALCLSLVPMAAAEDAETIDIIETEDDTIILIDPDLPPADLPEAPIEPVANESGVCIEDAFPDTALRAQVGEEFDTDGDGYLSSEEILNATILAFDATQVASLQGIEYLRYLENLECINMFEDGLLTEVDLSGNSMLKVVNLCFNPGLNSLDVSMLPKLEELNVGFSGLSEIDLSRNPELRCLWIDDAAFTSINLSYNPKLEILDVCGNPELTTLDIHACPSLVADYRAGGRHLAWMAEISQEMYDSIIVYGGDGDGGMDDHDYHLAVNTGMTILDELPLTSDFFPDNAFRTVVAAFDTDTSGSLSAGEIAVAKELNARNQGIRSLKGIEYLTALEALDCSGNQINTLDFSHNYELRSLEVSNQDYLPTHVPSLNVSNCAYLRSLSCSNCGLHELDVSQLENLMILRCSGNSLEELDLANNSSLLELNIASNQLETVDLSKNEALEVLDVSDNPDLIDVDLSGLRALQRLTVCETGLSELDISVCPLVSDAYLFGTKSVGSNNNTYTLSYDEYDFILSISPSVTVLAAQRCGDEAIWSFADGTLTISGSGGIWDVVYGLPGYVIFSDAIENLVIEEGISSVGGWAFMDKYAKLKTLSLPNTLKTISSTAFRRAGLTEVSFPASIETVVGWAFEDCADLHTIRFVGHAPDLNFCCFNGVTATVYYPANDATWTAAKIQDYYDNHHITGEEDTLTWVGANFCGDNAVWTFENGTLTITGTGQVWSSTDYPDEVPSYEHLADQIERVVVGEGITILGSWAFYENYTNLKTVSLPSTLKEIWNATFYGSGLTEVTFPASLEVIVGWAFEGCTELETICFTGPAPELNFCCFNGVTATVYYPADDISWTQEKIDSYSNAGGNLTWTPIAKPAITTQPKSVSAKAGDTVTFTVAASGGALSYQWQYRTSSTGSWNNSSAAGARTASFSVKAETYRNGYQYRCKVTNSAGVTTSNAATLSLVTAPVITSHPSSVSIAAGSGSAKFTVAASGSGLSYQWQYRTSSAGTWTDSAATGAKTATLTVTAESHRNGYQYRCKVTNAAGTVTSNPATLTVTSTSKPTITTQPKSQSATVGTTVKFTVGASGSGLSYQWQYRTSSTGDWNNSTASSAKTATFSVTAESYRSGYQYRCKVTNAAGTVTSNAATLTVCVKPTVTAQPTSKTATAGETVKFTVKASGGMLSYQWYYRTSASGSWNKCSNGTDATLSVEAKTYRNGYQYRCLVKNLAGEVYSSSVTLTVK